MLTMRNPIYANIISSNIVRLFNEFPGVPISTHLVIALEGRDLYNMSDKELAQILTDYLINQELFDSYMSDDSSIT